MAQEEAPPAIYQFHILLLKISPAIWRRVLVSSDQSLADFHNTLQIVMGWDDSHLHRFLIHGRAFGVTHDGGLCFRDNPKRIRLSDLHLRIKERFLYEYDFHAFWQHQIRLERTLPFNPRQKHGGRAVVQTVRLREHLRHEVQTPALRDAQSTGMQMNQQVIFLSDGGDDVRELQLYLNPQAEHVLDWFHVTMRLTVVGQLAKGLARRA